MTIKEFAEYLRISLSSAYKISRMKGFPKYKIMTKILIPTQELKKWLMENSYVG